MRACAIGAMIAVGLLAASAGASAQSYPERPVRVLRPARRDHSRRTPAAFFNLAFAPTRSAVSKPSLNDR